MNTKSIRTAAASAAAMALAFAAVGAPMAFADATIPGGADGTRGVAEVTDNTVQIAKEIRFVNGENSQVMEPNITYTYTISAVADPDATVTDDQGISGKVKAGVATAPNSTTSTVSFADSAKSNSSNTAVGVSDKKYASFTFDPTKFSAPGIYRYKIEESVTGANTRESVGVTQAGEYNPTRFLDVYVKKNANDESVLEIYGYVLSEDTKDTDFKGTTPTENLNKKSEGYVNTGGDSSSSTPADVDVYKTENLVIDKSTTGAMADKANLFPLNISVARPAGVSAAVKANVALGGGAEFTGYVDDATRGGYVALADSLSARVKDASVITVVGVPEGTKVSLTETNNTPDSYKVKAGTTAGGADLLAEAIVASNGTSNSTAQVDLSTTKKEIHITNTLDAISPTGIMLRYAPYALILAAGATLFVVAARGSKEKK